MSRFCDHFYVKEARSFLEQKNVDSYRGRRISRVPDPQITGVCHQFCEENGLIKGFNTYRETLRKTVVFCPAVTGGPACNGRDIEKTLCEDIQMAVSGIIKKQSIPEFAQVHWERAETECPQCRFCIRF